MKKLQEESIDPFWSQVWIPDKGYVWLDSAESAKGGAFGKVSHSGPPFLVVNPNAVMARRENPIEENKTLHMEFALLNPTKESILEFANKYGWLGIGEYCHQGHGSNLLVGEALELWRTDIQDMILTRWIFEKSSVDDLATLTPKDARQLRRDRKDLESIFDWNENRLRIHAAVIGTRVRPGAKFDEKAASYPARSYSEVLAGSEEALRPDLLQAWIINGKNPIQPAHFYVLRMVNTKLASSTSPRLFLERGKFAGRIVPRNLLGLIWLQFYREICGQTRIRQCVVCEKWMDVTESRSTKRMHEQCSKAERMKRWQPKAKKGGLKP